MKEYGWNKQSFVSSCAVVWPASACRASLCRGNLQCCLLVSLPIYCVLQSHVRLRDEGLHSDARGRSDPRTLTQLRRLCSWPAVFDASVERTYVMEQGKDSCTGKLACLLAKRSFLPMSVDSLTCAPSQVPIRMCQ